MNVVLDQLPAFAEEARDTVLYRVAGYFDEPELTEPATLVGRFRDDKTGVQIIVALIACKDRAEAIQRAHDLGWIDPLVEEFRAERREVLRDDHFDF